MWFLWFQVCAYSPNDYSKTKGHCLYLYVCSMFYRLFLVRWMPNWPDATWPASAACFYPQITLRKCKDWSSLEGKQDRNWFKDQKAWQEIQKVMLLQWTRCWIALWALGTAQQWQLAIKYGDSLRETGILLVYDGSLSARMTINFQKLKVSL